MTSEQKGESPFNPGQPVPVELFVGRREQIERIMRRGAGQVSRGKPIAIFVQGEYGIGKSSIARYTQWLAEKDYGLWPVYAPLGGAMNLGEAAEAVLQAAVRSGLLNPSRTEKVRSWFSKYVGKQDLFGITLNLDELKKDAPGLVSPFGMLDFLGNLSERAKASGGKGVFLALDEINGITRDENFSFFLKSLIDANAISGKPVPLLLMLCGVEEKRWEMIKKHEPVGRIFDIVEIETLSRDEAVEFFERAFRAVRMPITQDALENMTFYSTGFPKIMHLIGDAAYWIDRDGTIDSDDALKAVLIAADEFGKKHIDKQVYDALRSADYRSILSKIAKRGPLDMTFKKSEIAAELNESEKKKFDNFLQKMKRLKVLKSGTHGEYLFIMRMARLYIWLQSREKTGGKP